MWGRIYEGEVSYSYSKISTFNSCPYKFKLKYVDKLESPFEDSVIFEKGRFIHALLEFYPTIPDFEFKFPEVESKKNEYISLVKSLYKSNRILNKLLDPSVALYREKQFYLDTNLKEISTKESSFLNGIIDYVGRVNDTLLLVDWKTGKTQSHASLDQLKFYALWAFNNLDINQIKCSLFFLEQNDIKSEILTRADLPDLESLYKSKINTIETETRFEKKRSKSCEYCPFIKECQRINLRRN